MKKTIKKFINASIITEVAFILLGLVFIIWPGVSLDIIRWIISIFCLAVGAYFIALDFTKEHKFMIFSESMLGTLLVILGVVFAVKPGIMTIFPVVLGAWFVVSAVSSCRVAADLKGSPAFMPTLIAAVLSILAGILLMINPWEGSEMMMMFVGIVVVVHAASSLVDMVILKRNIKTVERKVKDVVANIREGEVKE